MRELTAKQHPDQLTLILFSLILFTLILFSLWKQNQGIKKKQCQCHELLQLCNWMFIHCSSNFCLLNVLGVGIRWRSWWKRTYCCQVYCNWLCLIPSLTLFLTLPFCANVLRVLGQIIWCYFEQGNLTFPLG